MQLSEHVHKLLNTQLNSKTLRKQLCILKRRKMENTGFLGSRVGIYYVYVSFFLKFSQINNNIAYLLTAQKRIIFILKFLCASHLKIKHF